MAKPYVPRVLRRLGTWLLDQLNTEQPRPRPVLLVELYAPPMRQLYYTLKAWENRVHAWEAKVTGAHPDRPVEVERARELAQSVLSLARAMRIYLLRILWLHHHASADAERMQLWERHRLTPDGTLLRELRRVIAATPRGTHESPTEDDIARLHKLRTEIEGLSLPLLAQRGR